MPVQTSFFTKYGKSAVSEAQQGRNDDQQYRLTGVGGLLKRYRALVSAGKLYSHNKRRYIATA